MLLPYERPRRNTSTAAPTPRGIISTPSGWNPVGKGSGGSGKARHDGGVEPGEAGTHRDAVTGSERLDDGHTVAGLVEDELAPAECSVRAGVATGAEIVEPGQYHLEPAGLEGLVVPDHVEQELAGRDARIRQRVLEDVAVATGEGHIGVADADPRLGAAVDHVHLGVGIGRLGDDVGRGPEVVADDALIPAPGLHTEVDVDDFADAEAVGAVGSDGHLLGVELLGPDGRVGTCADQPETGEERHHHDHEPDDHVAPERDPVQHVASVTDRVLGCACSGPTRSSPTAS